MPDGEKEGLDKLAYAADVFRENRTKAFMHLAMGEAVAQPGEYPIFVFNPMPYEIECPVEAEFTLADQNWDENTVSKPVVYVGEERIPVQQIKENSTINLDWRKRIVFEGRLKPMALTRFSVFTKTEKAEKTNAEGGSIDEYINRQSLLKAQARLVMYDDSADPWAMSDGELAALGTNPVDFTVMSDAEAEQFTAAPGNTAEHLTEDGEIFAALEKYVKCSSTRAVLEYRFYKNQPYTDIKVTVEFGDKNKLVRLMLPIGEGQLCGDGAYVTENKGNNEVVYQKWLGVSHGDGITAVINDGVYGGKKSSGGVELTLVRGAGYLFHPIGDRELYPTDRYLPRIDCGRYTWSFRIARGSVEQITNAAQLFNEKPYALNVFPIAAGKKYAGISTDKPVNMTVCKYENGSLLMRFFNSAMCTREFSLYVKDTSAAVTMPAGGIVTAVYGDNEIRVYDEII